MAYRLCVFLSCILHASDGCNLYRKISRMHFQCFRDIHSKRQWSLSWTGTWTCHVYIWRYPCTRGPRRDSRGTRLGGYEGTKVPPVSLRSVDQIRRIPRYDVARVRRAGTLAHDGTLRYLGILLCLPLYHRHNNRPTNSTRK